MKLDTTLKLFSAIRSLMQVMEVLNAIDEHEWIAITKIAKAQKKEIKNICFSTELGNRFMTVFRVREWLEVIANEK
jgi:hypothetical protein